MAIATPRSAPVPIELAPKPSRTARGTSRGSVAQGQSGDRHGGRAKGRSVLEVGSARKFDVAGFCARYGIKRDLISRMTSFAPRTVATWAAGKPLNGAAILKVTELKRLTKALEQLVEPASIGPWLQTPNEAFEGSTPAQLVERGEVDRLWRMIHLLESGQPG